MLGLVTGERALAGSRAARQKGTQEVRLGKMVVGRLAGLIADGLAADRKGRRCVFAKLLIISNNCISYGRFDAQEIRMWLRANDLRKTHERDMVRLW